MRIGCGHIRMRLSASTTAAIASARAAREPRGNKRIDLQAGDRPGDPRPAARSPTVTCLLRRETVGQPGVRTSLNCAPVTFVPDRTEPPPPL